MSAERRPFDPEAEPPHAVQLREAKRVLRRAKADAGVDYQDLATAMQRSVNVVYRLLDTRDHVHHFRLGDLLALSRSTSTAVRVFAHMVVSPVVDALRTAQEGASTQPPGARITHTETTSTARVFRIVIPIETSTRDE